LFSSPQTKKSEDTLLKCEGISHSFEYPLFNDVRLSLDKKESIAILGISGSGKSSLLHILSTLLKPNSGKVIIDGKDIYTLSQDELLSLRREDIGIIFQSHYLFNGFSAYENIELSSVLTNQPIDKDLIKLLSIDNVLDKKVTELSGGQQQRVSIARVLVKKPKIVFADEPTGNLDRQTARNVIEAIFDYIYDKEAALFLVTHDEELAKKCDKIYRLKEANLIREK
jgi:putative ABC transport system ATP-binding protein